MRLPCRGIHKKRKAVVRNMALNIEQILDLLLKDPFWEVPRLNPPEPAVLESFIHTYRLPEDYVRLLAATDGLTLFQAGDYRIDRMEEITQWKKNPWYSSDYLEDILVVGYFMDYYLVINQRESATSSYLYAGIACSLRDYVRVGTITDFLNGLIKSKGEIPFWETEDQELFDFSADSLPQNPGILDVPARGRTIVSKRPYIPSEEEVRVSESRNAVIVAYSNGTEETFFLPDPGIERRKEPLVSKRRGKELSKQFLESLMPEPGVTAGSAEGKTVVSIQPEMMTEEELELYESKGYEMAVIEYSDGTQETVFGFPVYGTEEEPEPEN